MAFTPAESNPAEIPALRGAGATAGRKVMSVAALLSAERLADRVDDVVVEVLVGDGHVVGAQVSR